MQKQRAELAAERAFRKEMRRIEGYQRQRARELLARRPRGSAIAAITESDAEVEGNIPPELHGLWQRIKSRIRGSERATRTEVFLEYAEEHPDEILAATEDRTDQLVRELEQRERQLARKMRKGPGRRCLACRAAGADDVPF